MQVILRSDLAKLGKRGDIVDVADGYGRNYLLPRGLAIGATPGARAQASVMRASRDRRDAADREAAEKVARTLVPLVIRVATRVGAGGKLFGSVTAADLVAAVETQTGIVVDRKKVHLVEPIKTAGVHEIPVKLHTEVEFRITAEVVSGG
ncbi:MAG: 50S ribosomal protein L9 [Acidimicrobiales bacterium]